MRWGWGIIGSMAPRDISRALSRTAVAIAALMLVVATVIALSIIIDSFRLSVADWVQKTIRADIYVLPMDFNALTPDLIDEIQQAEEVAHVSPIWETIVISPDDGPVAVRAMAPLPGEDEMPLLWSIKDSYQEAAAALETGDVAVTEAFARYHHLPLDRPSILTLKTDHGPQNFRVVGIFYDYQAPGPGYILMRPHVYQAHWQNRSISLAGLYLKPEATTQTEDIMQQLKQQLADRYSLIFLSSTGVRKSILTGFERSFTLTTTLRLLAAIVGFIGIFSTLMLLQFDRTRELGILRANGMTIRQLWRKTLLETALMGLTAGLMALPVGLALAYLLVQLVNTRFVGWVVDLHLNGTTFLLSLVIPLIAALLAGLYPAFRLSRLEIIAAIREE
jgi:putative ABC transport system permease protein